jgi:pyruvate dehydrogenase E1 component alpha subunit
MYEPDLYRTKEEVEDWKRRDPIVLLQATLAAAGELDDARLAALTREVDAVVDDAVAFAESGPLESVDDLLTDVCTPTGS